ncbi:TolC family protein [Bacteroides salyersiae]|jgi:outer membrane protein|uniref:TolC family protein n=1 Tax=Bacteroides salyersiae TaxID=291644 RepID=UPI001C8CB4EA|nr:TolC family protein [Bacteroides salyersiae]
MSKFTLFIMMLCASLCSMGTYAQERARQVMSIDELFSLADRNSKSLRPYATGIEEAREGIRVAKNARLPEIDASLSFSYLGDGRMMDRDFSNGFNAPMPHYGNNFAIEASQAIYTGGAVSNGIALARLQEENAGLSLEANRDKVRFMLVGYYLDLFKQQNRLQVYEKNIEQTRQVLKDLRAKEGEGIVLKNDITRYELLLSNLELTHTQIRNGITILNNHLTTTLGLPADIRIVPDTTILSRVLPVEDDASWATVAYTNSPALKQMSLALQMTRHQDKIIRSERIPKIALFAGNRFDGPIIIEVPPINKNFNYWYVGVGVKYNFSSLYKSNKSVSRSKYTMRRTQEQYEDAKEQTELAVKADHVKYLESYVELNTQQKSVELANQNYAVISNRYKNDMALITDMLDASNSKLAAELQLVNAQINIVFNYYKLLYISGTL